MRYLLLTPILFFAFNLFGQLDSLVWDGLDRTYLLHLPSTYTATNEYPLVIAMHGGFGSAANIQSQSQLSVKADSENFIVVYPEGVKGGALNIRTWNAGICCGFASATNVDDVGFINTLIDLLINNYSIDTKRIYATGMSNGGFMSYRLACELSDRIAAIAPVAASMTMDICNPIRAIPVMDFHSYVDENIPYQGGTGSGPSNHYNPPLDSILNNWADLDSCLIRNDTVVHNNEYTKIVWSNCACDYQIEQYITTDGGHSWPGGLGTPQGDPVSTVINATDLLWSFFENYTLDCQTVSSLNAPRNMDIIAYPNPVKEKITIESSKDLSKIQSTIYNLKGEILMTFSDSQELDISGLSAGTYVLRIATNGETIIRKIIKVE